MNNEKQVKELRKVQRAIDRIIGGMNASGIGFGDWGARVLDDYALLEIASGSIKAIADEMEADDAD